MQSMFGTSVQVFLKDKRKSWNQFEGSETEVLQAADGDEFSDKLNGCESDYITLRLKRQRFNMPRWIIVIFAILAQTIVVAISYQAGKRYQNPTPVRNTPIPDFPQEKVTIIADEFFSLPPTPEVDDAWESLVPTERGLFVVDNPQDFKLPTGLLGYQGEHLYGLTWTHQIHCLNNLRVEFWKMLRNESSLHDVQMDHDEENRVEVGHRTHCFDYLRQTIMCTMDLTVEHAARGKNGELRNYINGLDTEHTCRNREAVFDFMREHAMKPARAVIQR